jgi:hypothetical protein
MTLSAMESGVVVGSSLGICVDWRRYGCTIRFGEYVFMTAAAPGSHITWDWDGLLGEKRSKKDREFLLGL